jgi:hypothetical protein
VTLDRIAQKPKITCPKPTASRGSDTILTIHWREIASYLYDKSSELYRFGNLREAISALLADFAALNPHVSFTFNKVRYAATNPAWHKWRTDAPTSAHWYRPQDMRNLIAAHIKEKRNVPVRDFVSDFDGLTRIRTRTDVLATAELERTHLSDLVRGDDVDNAAVERLLAAMREHSRPVNPKRLGVIGRDHVERYFASLGAKANSFRYAKQAFIDDEGLPVVVEIALGINPDAKAQARQIMGLNWSPVLQVPSSDIYMDLADNQIRMDDPVFLLIHVARPRFDYTDHGKGAVS